MTSTAEEKGFLRVAVAAIPRVTEIIQGFPADDRAGALETAERCFLAAALEFGCSDITAQSHHQHLGIAKLPLTNVSSRFGVEARHHTDLEGPIMKRLIIATLVGLTVVASLSTSAWAFRCLARSTNGVSTWGYGLFASRAQRFAVRHCRTAGGIDCHVVYCR
jgi:hypothetical protein